MTQAKQGAIRRRCVACFCVGSLILKLARAFSFLVFVSILFFFFIIYIFVVKKCSNIVSKIEIKVYRNKKSCGKIGRVRDTTL